MVRQLVQFKFNEEGAKLKSEAVAVTKSAILVGHESPQLIFDKPFLILMERKGAANPYFALWVDNPELLVPFTPEKAKQ
jgi:serine protease inhibitor